MFLITSIRRKDLVFLILLIVWFICDKHTFISPVYYIGEPLRLLSLNLDQKYKLVDQMHKLDKRLYEYAKFLRTQIPEDATILYIDMDINSTKDGLKYLSPEWEKRESTRSRLCYYLFPRKFIITDLSKAGKENYKIVYRITPAGVYHLNLYYPGQVPNVTP